MEKNAMKLTAICSWFTKRITIKKTLKATFVLGFLVLAMSCSVKEQGYTITGQVTGFADGTKLYLRNLSNDAVFDSAVVNKGAFNFKGYLLSPPEQIWLNTTIDNKFIYTNLLIGNDDIQVKGDIADFPRDVIIKGSKTQDDFNYFENMTKVSSVKMDSLLQLFLKLPESERSKEGKALMEERRAIFSVIQDSQIDYIKSHRNTFVSVIYLGYLKNRLPKDTVQKIFDKYTPEIKESKYAKVIEVFLRENISKIGDQYHDFEGYNQKDERVKFSEIRGEYTLIDFTSAFCGPCIQAADELLEIDKTYVDSLTIVSFSQDSKKDVWLKSLERDKVAWNSVWDGEGRYSETSIKYGIQGVPTFVLINPEGAIVDKWSGYGKGSLIKRLEKNLQ